ncbi:putative membrane protein [Mesobacillus selenatarsenatis SF-1]|uniref:Putative membrane protein n=1 Tax=Mesobacillus selenatarsenatis (strain DSM 18680 / JCM 14380 / FERM P-15431 / SF-1) TaxID=1321606 RepID=A0A0A8X4E6_MESS1|nr:putative membrane protein [Mesobacillus selenatarsenatis SF-1]
MAAISLAIMGAGFLATMPFQDSLIGKLLMGGFEAGLVGGLADWFAVTALFRHPMGIPIPHTALLPKNRDKVTRALINMLENDWLTKESIMDKFKQIHILDKIFETVEKELRSESVKQSIQSFSLDVVKKIDVERFAPTIEQEIKGFLLSADTSDLLQKASSHVLSKEYEAAAFNYVLIETEKWASQDEAKMVLGKLGKQAIDTTEADGLLKFAIQSFSNMITEEKVGNILQSFILKRMKNLQQEDNRYRHMILEKIRKELGNINEREALMSEIQNWKNKMVEDMDLTGQIRGVLAKSKDRVIAFIEADSFVDDTVTPVVKRFIHEIKEDESKVAAIESWLHAKIAGLIERNHSKIGKLVRENLDKLDTETLIDMMENNIGKDLQWIRVNGAVCGFLIGIGLTIFKLVVL